MDKINIFLSDWQIVFREGLHFILSSEENFIVAGESTEKEDNVKLIEEQTPDLVILNFGKETPGGIDVLHRIQRNLPSTAFILTLDDYDEERMFLALQGGANGCICKDITPDSLNEIVRDSSTHLYPVAKLLLIPGVASRTFKEFEKYLSANSILTDLLAHLTPIEQSLLERIAKKEPLNRENEPEQDIAGHLESIRHKLVFNFGRYEVFKAAQAQLSAMSDSTVKKNSDFITKEEFNIFKASIEQQLKTIQNKTD